MLHDSLDAMVSHALQTHEPAMRRVGTVGLHDGRRECVLWSDALERDRLGGTGKRIRSDASPSTTKLL